MSMMVAIGSATFPPVLNCRISTHTPTGTAHSGLRYCQYIKGTSGYEIAFFGIRLFEKPKKIELKQILIYWFVHIDSTATTDHRLFVFQFRRFTMVDHFLVPTTSHILRGSNLLGFGQCILKELLYITAKTQITWSINWI